MSIHIINGIYCEPPIQLIYLVLSKLIVFYSVLQCNDLHFI